MRKKIAIIILLVIISITIGINFSFADDEYTCDLILDGDKFELNEGEEVTYEVQATNINAESGIIAFSSTVNYDQNAFELNIEGNDQWSVTGSVDNFLMMTRKDMQPSNEDQAIATIKLKVKQGAISGDKTIYLSNIKFVMDNDKSFTIDDVSDDLTIYGTQKSQIENNNSLNIKDSTDELVSNEEKVQNDNFAIVIWRNLIITLLIVITILIVVFYFAYMRRK